MVVGPAASSLLSQWQDAQRVSAGLRASIMGGAERAGIQRGGVRKVEWALGISLARAGEMDVLSHCSAMMVCGVRHMRRAPSRQSAISIILALMFSAISGLNW